MIVCALNYNTSLPLSTDALAIASTAGEGPQRLDFPLCLGRRLPQTSSVKNSKCVDRAMRGEFRKPFEARAYVDTGPDRRAGSRKICGTGLAGKKHLPDQRADRVVVFSRRDRHDARSRAVAASRRKPHRRTCAGIAACALTLARPARSSSPMFWTRGVAFPTSRSSCAARFRENCASRWGATFSGATFARMFVRGTAARLVTALANFQPRRVRGLLAFFARAGMADLASAKRNFARCFAGVR